MACRKTSGFLHAFFLSQPSRHTLTPHEMKATLPFLYGRLVHRFGIVGAIIFSRAAGKKNRSSSGNSKVQSHCAQEYLT